MSIDDVTLRDRVWAAALEAAVTRYRFDINYLINTTDGLGQQQRATIRRTLRVMVAAGWLSHTPGSPRYTQGDKLIEVFDDSRLIEHKGLRI